MFTVNKCNGSAGNKLKNPTIGGYQVSALDRDNSKPHSARATKRKVNLTAGFCRKPFAPPDISPGNFIYFVPLEIYTQEKIKCSSRSVRGFLALFFCVTTRVLHITGIQKYLKKQASTADNGVKYITDYNNKMPFTCIVQNFAKIPTILQTDMIQKGKVLEIISNYMLSRFNYMGKIYFIWI